MPIPLGFRHSAGTRAKMSAREAAQAYDCAALVHFGLFARLNFPREG